MKKVTALLGLILILLFSSCMAENTDKGTSNNGNDDYFENHFVFKGESESWTGEMKVDSTLQFYERDGILGCESTEDNGLTVTYKRNVSELSSAKHIKIYYDAGPSGGGLEEELGTENPIQKTYTLHDSSSNGSLIQKDALITVTVTIDGKTESFEMKNQSQK